jgi:hypothetical protein
VGDFKEGAALAYRAAAECFSTPPLDATSGGCNEADDDPFVKTEGMFDAHILSALQLQRVRGPTFPLSRTNRMSF